MKLRRWPLIASTAIGIAIAGGAWAYATTSSNPPLPAAKQQDLQVEASRIAQARLHASPKPKSTTPPLLPAAAATGSWVPGIYQGGGQGDETAGLAQTGAWLGVVRGVDTAVLAGSSGVDSAGNWNATGRIVVETVTPITPDGTFTPYADPALPGPYRIVSATGNVVTLTAGNGNTFTFTADTNTFGS